MAVEKDIIVAVRARSDTTVTIGNVNAKYDTRTLAIDRLPPVDPSQHHWTSYVLAAHQVCPPPDMPNKMEEVIGGLDAAGPRTLPTGVVAETPDLRARRARGFQRHHRLRPAL